jgi:hypothetical protein
MDMFGWRRNPFLEHWESEQGYSIKILILDHKMLLQACNTDCSLEVYEVEDMYDWEDVLALLGDKVLGKEGQNIVVRG